MHICTITPSYLPHFGGAEVGTHLMLSYLAQNSEHRFSIITATTDNSLPDYEVMDGVEIYRYPRSKRWIKGYLPAFNAFQHVPHLVKRLQPDLINMTYVIPTGLAGWMAAKRNNIPVMMMLGGVDIYDPFNMPDRFLQSIAGYCMRNSDVHVAWSNWTANRLASHFGLQRNEITVIPFGFDDERFNINVDGTSIRERYHIPDDRVVLFALQRLEARKGIHLLIQAIKIVCDTVPEIEFKLLIGGKGRDGEQLKQLITTLNLDDYIQLIGFIAEEEKAQHYAMADIFTFHSYHEGLGIVIIEASACGLAVVTTRAGGTVDVVKEGKTALLTEPGDPQALADSIIMLLKDPSKRESMGQAGANFALANFRNEAVSQKLLEIIESIH